MKERPILFSAPMVRAILEGRKTMTRRVVKPQPESRGVMGVTRMLAFKKRSGPDYWLWPNAKEQVLSMCPYGQPGDRLWVREAWQVFRPGSNEPLTGPMKTHPGGIACTGYAATEDERCREYASAVRYNGPWRASIHMPRWASRLTLEVTGVRVERLQDITPAQILAEGVQIPATPEGQALIDISTKHGPAHFLPNLRGASTEDLLRAHWAALWAAINGIESWHANPWVWVVEFKRADQAKAA